MIEIVGFAVRAPGASDQYEFWDKLKNGVCSVTEIPEERWSKFHYWHPREKEKGKSYSFAAGVLDDVWSFDPAVFGISPREAEQMDPQQRVLLETTWEAIENAGVAPSRLSGENVGVYVGASALDYGSQSVFDSSAATGHFMTGNTLSIISNRLSYVFNLKGPSFTVDTACSSSLVALSAAYQAISSGEIDTAIVAGVNILASPFPYVGFAQATMLSPEGLCRAFDKDGMGYVRAEGCVSIVLRRSDAPRWPGQRSHADILAVDTNCDGKTVGLSLPSSEGQSDLLAKMYQDNDINYDDIAFIEAHGTGTRVGDPAEAESIGNILGQKRDAPLPIGSAKTNFGHLEPAAGLLGVAKSILALQNDYFPASLHFDTPNPDIDFDDLNIAVAKEGKALPRTGKKRIAGINSFGFGGTNAHVIISDPARNTDSDCSGQKNGEGNGEGDNKILLLSAQTPKALRKVAKTYANHFLNITDAEVPSVCSAAYYRRHQFRERLAVSGNSVADFVDALTNFSNEKANSHCANVTADVNAAAGKCAFVFSGNGSQWPEMGIEAYHSNDQFRASFEKISKLFERHSASSLVETLLSDDLAAQIELTSIAQPLVFAVQVALVDALAAFGIKPDIVFGHSIGEVAASVAAKKLSLESAVHLVHARSTHQEKAAGTGTMAALVLSEEEAIEKIKESGFINLEVAAVNSFKSVTLSGTYEDIDGFAKFARRQKFIFRKIALDYPFHSKLIRIVEEPFKADLKSIAGTNTPSVMISTVTGQAVDGSDLDIDYWWDNLSEQVKFSTAIEKACELGATCFVEIGPKPVLQGYVKQGLEAADHSAIILPSLDAKMIKSTCDPIIRIILKIVAEGGSFQEEAVFGDNIDKTISLPTYQWQKDHYRFSESGESYRGIIGRVENPVLGWRVNASFNTWQTHIDPHTVPFVADHKVGEQIVFPGAAYVEILLAVAREYYGNDVFVEIKTMDIIGVMYLSDQYLTEVQTSFNPETGSVEISSRRRGSEDDWLLNAKGSISEAVTYENEIKNTTFNPIGDIVMSADDIYNLAASYGLNFGPTFQNAKLITRIDDAHYCVQLSSKLKNHAFGIHPAALDSCFHGLLALFDLASEKNQGKQAYIPIYFEKIQQFSVETAPAYAEITIRKFSPRSILADFKIFDEESNLLVTISGGRFRAIDINTQTNVQNLIYRVEKKPSGSLEAASVVDLPSFDCLLELCKKNGSSLDKEEAESRLLLDAASQVLASELCLKFANNGVLDAEDFPSRNREYYTNALSLMMRAEEWSQTGGTLYTQAEQSELPDFDILIKSIVEECPEETPSVTLLSFARKHALSPEDEEAMPFNHTGALLDHACLASPSSYSSKHIAGAWIALVLRSWPKNCPITILCLGGVGYDLAANTLTHFAGYNVTFCIAEINSERAARLSAGSVRNEQIIICDISKGWDQLPEGIAFDCVISTGQLHSLAMNDVHLDDIVEHLAPNASFVAFEPIIDNFHDFAFGLQDNWFDESLIDDFPIGPLKTGEEWEKALTDLNFDEIASLEQVVDGISMSIISGRYCQEDVQQAIVQSAEKTHWVFLIQDNKQAHSQAQNLQKLLEAEGASTAQLILPQTTFDTESNADWRKIRDSSEFAAASSRYILYFTGSSEADMPVMGQVMGHTLPVISLAQSLDGFDCVLGFINPNGSGLTKIKSGHAIKSAVWTFARVVANEVQNLDVKSVDVDFDLDQGLFAKTVVHALTNTEQNEFMVEDDCLLSSHVALGIPESNFETLESAVLAIPQPGSLDGLTWVQQKNTKLDADSVEIEVAATALNFRDLMWAMGMLPEEALEDGYGGASMGLECSGRIVKIGSNVKDFQIGDSVVAFTSSGFGNRVIVPAFSVAKIPDRYGLTAMATMPVAFLTSYYSLIELGGLKKDQWVLIHGGAGGVGLAALQIAKWVGARVIATAGNEEKRELLKMLGAEHVLDSRSLQFAEEAKNITGEGVHVVLNSLAGEAMERGIDTLRPFGRFLELGKRDYYGNTKIGLRPFRKNISYFGIDLDQLLQHDKDYAQVMIKDVFKLVNDGTFTPLPYRLFDGEQVQDAFRLMQRSGQIGKILVQPPAANSVATLKHAEPIQFSQEGAHIVVGGLGGFGSEIVKWLADHGAKTIVLTGRSGKVSAQHKSIIASLRDRNVNVITKACDISHHKSVETLLTELRADMPIKSIIHAAMVLDDGLLTSLNKERFEKVLAPKVSGIDHLNKLTWQDDLEHFISFSSATTLIGNPGQANYVAANGYLEGLARERRKVGKPAIAVGWGAIGDVGFLARNQETSDKLSRYLGVSMITAREGLNALADAIAHDDGEVENAVLHIGKFDWEAAQQALPILKNRMFKKIVDSIDVNADAGVQLNLVELVLDKDDAEATPIITNLLKGEIASILRISKDEIDIKRPLTDLGMDSLMGLELRMSVQKRFDIEMPLVALSGTTNMSDIALQMLNTIRASETDDYENLDSAKTILARQHFGENVDLSKMNSIDKLVTEKKKSAKK